MGWYESKFSVLDGVVAVIFGCTDVEVEDAELVVLWTAVSNHELTWNGAVSKHPSESVNGDTNAVDIEDSIPSTMFDAS